MAELPLLVKRPWFTGGEYYFKTTFMKYLLLIATLFFMAAGAAAQTTYYVDQARPDNAGAGTSWATAKKDLQNAINAAASGDQVFIKAGTYLPTQDPFGSASPADNRDKTFTLKNGVKVYGGFAGTETLLSQRDFKQNVTVLSGDLGVVNNTGDNSYHVVISVNLNSATVLDGVVVSSGTATASWPSSLVIGGRTIDRYKGGGIYNSYSATTFSNCTIRANSADCTNTNDDAWGAGMVNEICTSSITNCIFDGNFFLTGGRSFGVFGAGMLVIAGACTINNCAFINNSSGSGFLDASRGGGLYIENAASTVSNCVFYNNSSQNGAGVLCGGSVNNTTAFTNCSFIGNTSSYAGTAFSGFAKASFRNCIFWNNPPTVSQVAGRNEIYSQETNAANFPVFSNCIIRDAAGAPLAITGTVLNNCSNSNPLLVNIADGDGPDNTILTADDGLRLQCGSPAVNTGAAPAPANDVLGIARVGNPDMGAYEGNHASTDINNIPSANAIVVLAQNAAGITYYSDCSSKLLQVQSGGAYTLGGTVTAKVWVQAAQPADYTKRYYAIHPALLPDAATGRVTLYFRQQEFTDFNAVNAVKLPTGPADAAGIANINIEKRAGISSNGTGLPETYPGARTTITNSSLAITWNATAARWEVSFNTTGFGGFFLKSKTTLLPLTLVDFSGVTEGNSNRLAWITANEINTSHFEIEKSEDGIHYIKAGQVAANGWGGGTYRFTDNAVSAATFYRLKMVDNDGTFTYSNILVLGKNGKQVSIFPNPVTDVLTISSNSRELNNTRVNIYDNTGKLLQQLLINKLPFKIDVNKLPKGMYYLSFGNGERIQFIK